MGTVQSTEALVRRHAAVRPLMDAATCGGDSITFADLNRRADQAAHGMAGLGMEPGDRVAWLGRNAIDHLVLQVAAERVGAILTPLNWRLAAGELQAVLTDSTPRAVLLQPEFLELLRDAMPAGSKPTLLISGDDSHECPGFASWTAAQRDDPVQPTTTAEDGHSLMYTSGTSGVPKGVLYTCGRWAAALAAPVPWKWDRYSVPLIVAPVFHLAGGSWTGYALRLGARQILLADASPGAVMATLQEEKVTHAQLVPAVLATLLPELRKGRRLPHLSTVVYGASPIPLPLLAALLNELDCDFVQVYGLTETFAATYLDGAAHRIGYLQANRPPSGEAARRESGLLASAGRPGPAVSVRVIDPDTGTVLPDGRDGEVVIQSDFVMDGYWRRSGATRDAIDPEGWVHTGDGGHLREGFLYLTGRIKDLIISGGENIYPAEIENVLSEHPGVAEVAVVAMPHPRWGEAVRAVVAPRDGAILDAAELAGLCRSRLASYKCPAQIDIVPALPRNPAGKILRDVLRGRSSAVISSRPEAIS